MGWPASSPHEVRSKIAPTVFIVTCISPSACDGLFWVKKCEVFYGTRWRSQRRRRIRRLRLCRPIRT